VTQQNAASAEESASASEEMSAQAETMKAMVNDLLTMVGGGLQKDANLSRKVLGKKLAATGQFKKQAKKTSLQQDNSKDPGKLIPLEEADFKDF